jgi:hypothetical protein
VPSAYTPSRDQQLSRGERGAPRKITKFDTWD